MATKKLPGAQVRRRGVVTEQPGKAGQDKSIALAERQTEDNLPPEPRSPQDGIEFGRPRVRYFISYTRDDNKIYVNNLLKKLKHLFSSAKGYRFQAWRDTDILVGKHWHQSIQQALDDCDFGLLLISPAFLANGYIQQHELPHFTVARKPVVPVALVNMPSPDHIDYRGLEQRQIFYHPDQKSFQDQQTDRQKQQFANALFEAILRMLDSTLPPEPAEPPAPAPCDTGAPLDAWAAPPIPASCVGNEVIPHSLDKAISPPPQSDERQDALAFLRAWMDDTSPDAAPYCALLGEYGMGKTTTCVALCRDLLNARKRGERAALPHYLDLRLLGEQSRGEPDLTRIIETVLKRSWKGGETAPHIGAGEIIRQVQEEGALVIFDGLDEVLVHLSAAAGQRFIRELYRILPPALWAKPRTQQPPGPPGRVLMTCRSHFFRTLRDQSTFLTAEGWDGISATAYKAFVLLPFTESQIQTYLEQTLPERDSRQVLETLAAVHNLTELAGRPYTLSLIVEHLPQIKRWKQEGRTVTGVDLYRVMVVSWLERDQGKHQLTPEHKQELMEHFAAALWRSGRRTWSIGDIEQWLMDFFSQRPDRAAHYAGKDRELLKEDLRTATFLVREGESNDQFRFAHSSLLEFFLAGYLWRSLRDGQPENWALPAPSPETLDFLGQWLSSNPESHAAALASLRRLRDTYHPQASERAFAYGLLALERGYPTPALAGFRLEGADLRDCRIVWPETRAGAGLPWLDLRRVCFENARLGGSVFQNVNLEGATFAGADLFRAEFLHSRAEQAVFARASLSGTLFRHVRLTGADFRTAVLSGTRFLHCTLPAAGLDAAPPAAFFALCQPPRPLPAPLRAARPSLAILTGHQWTVHTCAFSPDGHRLATAGEEGEVWLREADSDTLTAALRGHTGIVRACAFAPDSRRLATAGNDGTLRLWRTDTGAPITVCTGHQGPVTACAFSADGRWLATGGDDGTIRLWDPQQGKAAAVFTGGQGSVNACAFAPDGRWLATAGDDGTVRLWDPQQGKTVAVLTGHRGPVYACAFSPDGRWLATGGKDRMVRLWDPQPGEITAVLTGHQERVCACAFAPDGRWLATGGEDGTVRLWDPEHSEMTSILTSHLGSVRACAFSADGRRLATVGGSGDVRVWDSGRQEQIARFRPFPRGGDVHAFAPDGRHIFVTDPDGRFRLRESETGRQVREFTGHHGWIRACAFSADGRHILSVGGDCHLRLWETETGTRVRQFPDHGSLRSCALSPDGRRYLSGDTDGHLSLWETRTGKRIKTFRGHRGWVTACAFSPDGRRILSGDWGGQLRLWETMSGKLIAEFTGHDDEISACAFSPDGRRVLSADRDGILRLWEAETGKCVRQFTGHHGEITACAFSPDGRYGLSAGLDGTLRTWDLAAGAECGVRIQRLPEDGFVAVDPQSGAVRNSGGEAWRWLGWQAPDPVSGHLTRYPAESFGPLPGGEEAGDPPFQIPPGGA